MTLIEALISLLCLVGFIVYEVRSIASAITTDPYLTKEERVKLLDSLSNLGN